MAIVGMLFALGGFFFGLRRSRAAAGGYYETEVYALSAVSHRRFATASIVFAAAFALLEAIPIFPVFPVLAAYVLLAILYATSFARGAQEEEES
jgi:hypothetical protein